MTGWTHQPITFYWKLSRIFIAKKSLTLRICFQVNEEHPGGWTQPFDYDYLSWARPWGAVGASSGLLYVNFVDYFQGLYIVSNCSWWQKSSAWLCRNQSHSLTDITWMSALPGAYCECADELRESHPLLSGPVVAPVFGEPCSWCPCAPLDFWLSEQTAAGKRKRQVVCKILGEAQGNWEVNIKAINGRMFAVQISDKPSSMQL